MPLKDRDRTRPRRLIRLGIIRLGYKEERKRKDGSTYTFPRQADHFLLHDAPDIQQFYGEGAAVRELDVILPFPDIARNFDGNYTVWAGGVLVCKGDGESVQFAAPFRAEEKDDRVRVYNAEGDTLVSDGQAQVAFDWNGQHFDPGDIVPCSGAAQDLYPHCRACRLSAILKVMMADPKLFRLGYYQIATGSKRNYDTLLGTLELISGDGQRKVSDIPFKLRLVEEATTYREKGKRKATKKWFLQLEPDPDLTRQLYQQQAQALLGTGAPAVEVDEETGEILEAEEEAPPPFAEDGGLAEEKEWDEETFGAAEDPEKPKSTNGSRPLSPGKLKAFLISKAEGKPETHQTAVATPGQQGLVAGKLAECFAPADDADQKRHSVLLWLWGSDSTKDLTMAAAGATLDWLLDKDADEGTYDLHPAASQEAQAVLKEALKEAGQQELELEEKEA